MTRLRTFIAVDLGKPIRDRLVALQEKLAQTGAPVKWVEVENLHVTLLFLGEVEDRTTPAICQAVAHVCNDLASFPMTVERAGCFPNPRRPRILWVGIGDGVQEICQLHDALEPPLLELGCYRREERKYTPHITIGRVKTERPSDKLEPALVKCAGWRAGETTVREVLVMSSELTPQGPAYTILSRSQLA